MSILEWFRSMAASEAPGDTDTVRRIAAALDQIDEPRARYLAAFAYVLSRVAGADLQVSEAEMNAMREIVQRVGELSDDQARLVVDIARTQNRRWGGTEDFLVTREFRSLASEDECRTLLGCLFAVSAADDTISGDEEAQIRQIARELGVPDGEYRAVRLKHADKLTTLRQQDR